ncbi:MAG: MBL fold metallo-hydrolase RNA specificity domain-containing protein [Planctomycetota bacterium]|jgi:metallo-beta-lactamase family protein
MSIKLSFFGAARNVTGSRYLVEARGKRILVDCGMYQEREFLKRNWEDFPVPPDSIDAIVLTHAHLDHSGFVPRLVKNGYEGPVYGTPATCEIARIIFLDSGHIQEEDAKRKKRRHEKENRKGPYPEVPLYTVKDAERAADLFETVRYLEPLVLADGFEVAFHDAGHILGSSMVKLTVTENGTPHALLFSGDVGRWGKPILRDPTVFEATDTLVVESTYGDRLHKEDGDLAERIAAVVNATVEGGGNLVIPSFAVERAHELLYTLNALLREKRIPAVPVFLDSPMAIRVTEVFRGHPELWDEAMQEYVASDQSPFEFPELRMTTTSDESRAINRVKGGAVIIAGSGMCTGGRIKHHIVHNMANPASTLLFIGFQARGTLGRRIVSGERDVRIFGKPRRLKCRVATVHGFSGHADRDELLHWISGLKTAPENVFVTHGEEKAALAFGALLEEKWGKKVAVPEFGDSVELA